jgi:protein-tyrosine phosphatase
MIDIHCHILTDVDDGPKSITESLEMAKQAAEQGIHTIIATPHHHDGRYDNDKTAILEHTHNYEKLLRENDIPLRVLPGQEIRVTADLLEEMDQGSLLTLNENGKYLLVELPEDDIPGYTEMLIYQMQLKGFVPIVAHPERNKRIIEQPDILYQLVKQGALVQIGTKSIQGEFGSKVKKFVFQLLTSNMAHVIASNAHQASDWNYSLKDVYDEVKKKVGLEKVYMLQENAQSIVEGQMVHREQPIRIVKKRFGVF